MGWEGRDSEPNGTATEHREGGGPFGSESLYIWRRRKNCLSACFLCVAVLPLYCLALVVFFSLLLDFDVVAAQVASCFSFLWLWTLASSRSTPATPNKSNNSECRSSAQIQAGWG